jgi:hypothetical protein
MIKMLGKRHHIFMLLLLLQKRPWGNPLGFLTVLNECRRIFLPTHLSDHVFLQGRFYVPN